VGESGECRWLGGQKPFRRQDLEKRREAWPRFVPPSECLKVRRNCDRHLDLICKFINSILQRWSQSVPSSLSCGSFQTPILGSSSPRVRLTLWDLDLFESSSGLERPPWPTSPPRGSIWATYLETVCSPSSTALLWFPGIMLHLETISCTMIPGCASHSSLGTPPVADYPYPFSHKTGHRGSLWNSWRWPNQRG